MGGGLAAGARQGVRFGVLVRVETSTILLLSVNEADDLDHQHRKTGGSQRWQILFDDQPDRAEVNAQLGMHDHAAKPGEFAPGDLRLGALDLARQALT